MCLTCEMIASVGVSAEPPETVDAATHVIREYLSMPHPAEDRLGGIRMKRLRKLEELRALGPAAVAAVESGLAKADQPAQRGELAELLRHFPNEASANLLAQLLDDPNPSVRRNAIHSVRLLSRRVDRFGQQRTQRGEQFAPQVQGLVPLLIEAARDEDEMVRISATYALADTLDPTALVELRQRLEEPSPQVRLKAACLLTEFNDTSGLDELKSALRRLHDEGGQLVHLDLGMLLASLERITGKSFGPLPPNPMILSDTRQIEKAEREYERQLDAWLAWWAWQPVPNEE
jgi:hypothetical protein